MKIAFFIVIIVIYCNNFGINYENFISDVNISHKCRQDLFKVLSGITFSQIWALKIIDSCGKFEPGLLEGNTFSLGSFDECLYLAKQWNNINQSLYNMLNVNVPHYCRVDFNIGYHVLNKKFKNSSLNYFRAEDGEVVPIILRPPGIHYYHGWCLPSSCDNADIYNLNIKLLEGSTFLSSLNLGLGIIKNNSYPRLASVTCVDINNTIITYVKNKTLPNITPVIWDAKSEKNKYNIDKKFALRLAIPFFVTILFVIFGLAGLVDIYVTLKQKVTNNHFENEYLQMDHNYDPTTPLENDDKLGISYHVNSSFAKRFKHHVVVMCLAASPFRNFNQILTLDLSIFDNLPRRHITLNSSSGGVSGGGFIITTSTANTISARDSADVEQNMIPGLRALSVIWAVYASTYALSVPYVSNPINLETTLVDSIGLTLTGAQFVVDTLLFVSGYLTAKTLVVPPVPTHTSVTADLSSLASWACVYAYKYLRFTWLYLGVLIFHIFVSPYWPPHIAIGPMMTNNTGPASNGYCKRYWWINLLYLNNFLHPTTTCMPWTWYGAVEAQLFASVGPPLVFLFKRSPTLCVVIVAHLVAASVATSFALSFVNKFRSVFSINDPMFYNYFYDYFIRPYIRATPYLIGLIYGCYVYFYRNTTPFERGDEDEELDIDAEADNDSGINNAPATNFDDNVEILAPSTNTSQVSSSIANLRRFSRNVNRHSRRLLRQPVKRALIWLVMAVLACAIIYGIRPEVRSLINRDDDYDGYDASGEFSNSILTSWKNVSNTKIWKPRHHHPFTPLTAAFYNSLTHVFWPIFVLWILWSCARFNLASDKGRSTTRKPGGIIYAILSARIWLPLSNVAYAIYLIHPLLILAYYGSLRQPLYFTHTHFFMLFMFFTTVSFVIAILASLTFEIPLINLARIYLTK